MNKLILDIDHTNEDYGLTRVKVKHEPTAIIRQSICTDDGIEELTECLIQEVTSMVGECKNWLH